MNPARSHFYKTKLNLFPFSSEMEAICTIQKEMATLSLVEIHN